MSGSTLLLLLNQGLIITTSTATANGDSTANGIGASLFLGVGTATGNSTVSGVGTSLLLSIGTAVGNSTDSGKGASLFLGVGIASGNSTAKAINSLAISVGNAPGDSTASSIGSLALSIGTAVGNSTAQAISGFAITTGTVGGNSTAIGQAGSIAVSSGSSTASGVGASLNKQSGTAFGNSTATGQAGSIFIAIGDSTASAINVFAISIGTANGNSTAISQAGSIAIANGSSTAIGQIGSIFIAIGNSTANGIVVNQGAASGNSTASGIGASIKSGVGIARGDSTAIGLPFRGVGVGTASGNSTAIGVGIASSGHVETGDIVFVLSGGISNTNPNTSLGGDPSSYQIATGLGNLFNNLTDIQTTHGYTDYRCFYIFNNNVAFSFYDTSIWIESTISGSGSVFLGINLHNEIQQIVITGNITGGVLPIIYEGISVNWNWSSNLTTWALNLQNALNSINTPVFLSGVVVTASQLGNNSTFQVNFTNDDANRYQPVLGNGNISSLFGCTNVGITKVVSGSPINTIAPSINVATTTPFGINFTQPSVASPVLVGTLRNLDGFPIWIKRVIPAGAGAIVDAGFVVRFQGSPF